MAAGGFDKHLFISYAHIDNQPLTAEQQGWVSRFHASLQAMLSMRLGQKAEIWRDGKLTGTDVFADEIVSQFRKTALLISVLTPRYVESEWCRREVSEFCKQAEESGGLVTENKSRVIKVIKTPVESEDALPAVMRETLGYEFYTFVDEQTPIELDPAYGTEMAQRYNIKVAKLAWEIRQLLKKLESNTTPETTAPAEPAVTKPIVYLAECSYDRQDAREALEADLRLHGYSILPDHQLPSREMEYIAEVKRLLKQCKLSIHLVGAGYGAVPDGPRQRSVVMLQNETAIEQCKSGGLRRIIWVPEGTRSEHAEQQAFIEALHKDAEQQFCADLITADLEVLKGTVHIALQELGKPVDRKAAEQISSKLVYLICDEGDRRATIPLRKFLKAQDVEVRIPVFEGESAAVRQSNQESLAQCDGVMIFYGSADEAWKRTVESELRKSRAYRGEKPPPVTYTYLAQPATDEKRELIELEEANVIQGLNNFTETAIEPFLRALRGA